MQENDSNSTPARSSRDTDTWTRRMRRMEEDSCHHCCLPVVQTLAEVEEAEGLPKRKQYPFLNDVRFITM